MTPAEIRADAWSLLLDYAAETGTLASECEHAGLDAEEVARIREKATAIRAAASAVVPSVCANFARYCLGWIGRRTPPIVRISIGFPQLQVGDVQTMSTPRVMDTRLDGCRRNRIESEVTSLPAYDPTCTTLPLRDAVAPSVRVPATQDFRAVGARASAARPSPPFSRTTQAHHALSAWWWTCHNMDVADGYVAKVLAHSCPFAPAPSSSRREACGGWGDE